MMPFTTATRGTSTSFASIRCCATPPPMSWPATMTGPLCPSASRKRISQAERRGNEASRYRELTSGAPEAGEIDRHRAKARSGDAVEHGLPDATPIGAMKQQHQGAALAGREIADRNAAYVDCLAPRHRTILLTWSLPSPMAS